MIASFLISIFTFNGIAGLSRNNAMLLFIMLFVLCPSALLLYILLQVILVLHTLSDLWPLGIPIFIIGDIFFGLLFFAGAMFTYFFGSNHFCRFASHYSDGMFIGSLGVLFSVMMVYKYWDSITAEDLEFMVGGSSSKWHSKRTEDARGRGSGSRDLDDKGKDGNNPLHRRSFFY